MKENKNLPKICTTQGDNGFTHLNAKLRFPKSEYVFDLLGDLDELISYLAFCEIRMHILQALQKHLYKMMAGVSSSTQEISYEAILSHIETLCIIFDKKLSSFVHPDTRLDYARALCRRAERSFWKYFHAQKLSSDPWFCPNEKLQKDIEFVGKILNRFSDLLFLMARAESKNLPLTY